MEKLPLDILYNIFDYMVPPTLSALRNTSTTLLHVVDSYVWHKCKITKRQKDPMSKIISVIIDSIEVIAGGERRIVSLFMIKIVWRNCFKWEYYFFNPLYLILRHKIWGTLIKRNSYTPRLWRLRSELITEKRNQFIFYHQTIIKIVNEILMAEYPTDNFLSDDLGITFEKDFDNFKDVPYNIAIIYAMFAAVKPTTSLHIDRTKSEAVKIIMKLHGPLKIDQSAGKIKITEGIDIKFIYHFKLHGWDKISGKYYEWKYDPSAMGFKTIPFVYRNIR